MSLHLDIYLLQYQNRSSQLNYVRDYISFYELEIHVYYSKKFRLVSTVIICSLIYNGSQSRRAINSLSGPSVAMGINIPINHK